MPISLCVSSYSRLKVFGILIKAGHHDAIFTSPRRSEAWLPRTALALTNTNICLLGVAEFSHENAHGINRTKTFANIPEPV